MFRLNWALEDFKSCMSPGSDSIITSELQLVSDLMVPVLMRVFSGCIDIVFVAKSGSLGTFGLLA